MSSRPTGVGMSLAGRAAVMDLGLGSQLAEQAEETEEQRRQRLMRLMGQDTSSLLSLGNPYGV